MAQLLKAELYKLGHQKSFPGLLVFSLFLGSLMMLDRKPPASAADCFSSALYNIPLLYFLSIILCPLFVGTEFENRTLHAAVTAGRQRLSLFLAKGIVFLTASSCILTVPLFAAALAGRLFFGGSCFSHTARPAAAVFVIFMAVCAMGSLPFFLVFACRDVGKTLSLGMGVFFLMIFLLNLPDAQFLAPFLPMGQLRLLSLGQLSMAFTQLIFVDAAWVFLCFAGAGIIFCHADLT